MTTDQELASLRTRVAALETELAASHELSKTMIQAVTMASDAKNANAKPDARAFALEELIRFSRDGSEVVRRVAICALRACGSDERVAERLRQIGMEKEPIQDRSIGIYRKFAVERTDGSSGPGGKHQFCHYFVLDWIHDKFAPAAAVAYADACAREFPELARDLRSMAEAMQAADAGKHEPGEEDQE